MTWKPHEYWQNILPHGTIPGDPAAGYDTTFPATLPDGREIPFPIRVLPGDGRRAVASLIVNQASFAVEDALADAMAAAVDDLSPGVVIGVPTLGLGLANAVARRLGHERMIALGTSRKFWYDEVLSVPVRSITSPDQTKRLFFDPRMREVIGDRRVIVADDVVSTGSTLGSVLALLDRVGIHPEAAVFAMAQGRTWQDTLKTSPFPNLVVRSALATPRLILGPDGRWRPEGSGADHP